MPAIKTALKPIKSMVFEESVFPRKEVLENFGTENCANAHYA
jgi:hypothetical protein